jgi:hypothetical protein
LESTLLLVRGDVFEAVHCAAQQVDDGAVVHAGFDERHRKGGERVVVGDVCHEGGPIGRAVLAVQFFLFRWRGLEAISEVAN